MGRRGNGEGVLGVTRSRCDRFGTALALVALGGAAPLGATSAQEVQDRVAADVASGLPIVVHVVVALCDNEHQGIVPVPRHLGNGQDPASNLYWGALYGVRTHLARSQGWTTVSIGGATGPEVLDRIVLKRRVRRGTQPATVYLVADAWDGALIRKAISRFLDMAAARGREAVVADSLTLGVGGEAHLVAYVGHDGLMDFDVPAPREDPAAAPRDAVVLACASKPYFLDKLRTAGAHPLLLTTGLMAPEAYTLDAVVTAWAAGETPAGIRDRAARAYDRYQKCGVAAARRLFWLSESE